MSAPGVVGQMACLITNVTNVSVAGPTLPVTCQQPPVGKVTPLAWNPVMPYVKDVRSQRRSTGVQTATADP